MKYPTTEGKIPYAGFETWYTAVGEGDKTPLLMLHGGPGAGSDYMRTMDPLCEDGRRVIYYDQLGCGRSPAGSDPARWTIEFFVAELETLADVLGLSNFHLLGQSWGAALAVCYAAKHPQRLASLILGSPPLDMALWDDEMARLAAEMPAPHGGVLARAIAAGSEEDPAYPAAYAAFFQKHLAHLPVLPEMEEDPPTEVNRMMEHSVALRTTGTLKGVDLTGLLPAVTAPTLVIYGEYDPCTEAQVNKVMAGLPNARAVMLKDSGHMPNTDAPGALNAAVADFLREVEAPPPATS